MVQNLLDHFRMGLLDLQKFALAVGLGASLSAYAVPTLQLDGSNGIDPTGYDTTTDTVAIPGKNFSLYALLNLGPGNGNVDETDFESYNYFVSVALVPKSSGSGSFGTFKLGADSFDESSSKIISGTPPADDDFKDMPKHSIYPTRYIEKEITFSSSKTAKEYNTMDDPGGFTTMGADSTFLYVDILIDISDLDVGYDLHFDLYAYNKSDSSKIAFFAPFSHDAQSTGGGSHVPDGGMTAILLGLGTLGLFAMRRGSVR